MKNLEYIIFACIFYDYNLFLKVETNIFQTLTRYYDVLKELYEKRYDINRIFFQDILKQRKINHEKLDEVLDTMQYEYNNFDYYLNIYLEKIHKRNINILFDKFKRNEITVDCLKEDILNKKELSIIDNNEKNLFDIYASKDFGKPLPTVDIGLRFFNAELGWRNGELIVIAARPSIGKTAVMKQLALNCINKNISTGIFSLEMSANRISMDILALIARVSKRMYAAGTLDKNDVMKISKAKDEYREKARNLIINQERGIDIHKICQRARSMVKNNGVRIIFIDYLQIINAYHLDKKDLRIKINYIADKLQMLAGELDIPIVVLAQLSRDADSREQPILSNLKESGKIEENSDIVILMSVERFLDNTTQSECTLRNNVAKNRNGATGVYQTHFDRITGYINDCEYGACND